MKGINKGTIDYDYDRYGRKIRKYVVIRMKKVYGQTAPEWEQVEFTPETEIPLDTKKQR